MVTVLAGTCAFDGADCEGCSHYCHVVDEETGYQNRFCGDFTPVKLEGEV